MAFRKLSHPKKGIRGRRPARGNELTGPDVKPLDVRAHHLLCAICVRGGCGNPPTGRREIDLLLRRLRRYPYAPLRVRADLDINRAHYLDIYAGRDRRALPRNYWRRQSDFVNRRKDLETLRRLGIVPNTTIPAYLAYSILFSRVRSLEGICKPKPKSPMPSSAWPECPHARKNYYERVVGGRAYGLKEQTELGESMEGEGIWAILRPRTREEMRKAKVASVREIQRAERLFIRPNHLLCILCKADAREPLVEDNLVELRKRMEEEPDLPVTLTEGCCMVCDPCNLYHAGENICYGTHIKDQLRDLDILERLDLRPGATLSARELYERIYARIGSLRDICAWGDELDTAPFWSPCGGWRADALERARKANLIAGDGKG